MHELHACMYMHCVLYVLTCICMLINNSMPYRGYNLQGDFCEPFTFLFSSNICYYKICRLLYHMIVHKIVHLVVYVAHTMDCN